jgi:hypothetical protein
MTLSGSHLCIAATEITGAPASLGRFSKDGAETGSDDLFLHVDNDIGIQFDADCERR